LVQIFLALVLLLGGEVEVDVLEMGEVVTEVGDTEVWDEVCCSDSDLQLAF